MLISVSSFKIIQINCGIYLGSFFSPLSLSLRPGTIKNSRARLTKKRSKHKHTYAHIPRALFGLDHLLLLMLFLFSSPSLGIAMAVPLSCHKPSVAWCWFLTFASTRFQDFRYQVRLLITTIFTFHWIFFVTQIFLVITWRRQPTFAVNAITGQNLTRSRRSRSRFSVVHDLCVLVQIVLRSRVKNGFHVAATSSTAVLSSRGAQISSKTHSPRRTLQEERNVVCKIKNKLINIHAQSRHIRANAPNHRSWLNNIFNYSPHSVWFPCLTRSFFAVALPHTTPRTHSQ